MSNLQHEASEKFKKSDALNYLKDVCENMSKEDFLKFANYAMKTAYDKKRIKAVEYMLSFYEYNQPQLLMRIHLQKMLHEPQTSEKDKGMLKVLVKHFSSEFCHEVIEAFINFHGGSTQEKYRDKSKEILKFILEEKINIDETDKPKAFKI